MARRDPDFHVPPYLFGAEPRLVQPDLVDLPLEPIFSAFRPSNFKRAIRWLAWNRRFTRDEETVYVQTRFASIGGKRDVAPNAQGQRVGSFETGA